MTTPRSEPAASTAHGAMQSADIDVRLVEVAHFDHQVTGVSVTEDGRIFVNFPRWTEDTEVSVAELLPDGSLRPYPDAHWNSWRNAKKNALSPDDRWVCVQSVVADGRGSLWVIDPAAPAAAFLVQGGPKLVRIDLANDSIAQTIAFDEQVAREGSYLNDVRLGSDGRYAYITDSGTRGALVVVDIESGRARRVLDGHPSTQLEKDVVVKHHGREIRRTDGRGVEFSSDGIALSPDGETLYWQAVTGRTLYRIATRVLQDESLSEDEVADAVQRVGENGVADGLWIDPQGRMYISALEDDAIRVRDGERVEMFLQDERLRWPDTFSQGPDGTMYVTASRIMDSIWHDPDAPPRLSTTLFRFTPDDASAARPH
ncbi:L-dopachrome tautomerase-related protein [Cognatilysobacter terrigena]|uniref:L-dopachrome tautomerase-related protein n=1 Tax=Cognatilysobacter terrigena TaxID=2488749 RepID=UPI001AAE096E|nr:L-dopachrome tautomerase-related protein [Lysobacter terrigena]